jgi:predicted kinase
MLLLLNGAPGVGKSALAERYANDHALALVIEIDDLRRKLGQWESTEESKQIARDLAVALVRVHLGAGHDVIVPQYLGKREFVEQLRLVTEAANTRFVEVVVADDADAIVERFRQRRAKYGSAGVRHPEADLGDNEVAAAIRDANDRLRNDALAHGLTTIVAGAGVEAAYRALCDAITGTS